MDEESNPQPGTTEAIPRTPSGEIEDQSPSLASTTSETKTTQETESSSTAQASTETKTDESLLSAKDEAKTKNGAPEKYEDFTAPDGYELDKATLEKAVPIFKELGLSQEAAQKLVDFYADISKADAESQQNRFREMVTGWRTESMNLPEFKGKLEKGGPVLTAVAKVIDDFGPELAAAFRETMDLTGVGNHPVFLKAMYKIAGQLAEPRHVAGGGPSKFGQAAPGRAQGTGPHALYPGLT